MWDNHKGLKELVTRDHPQPSQGGRTDTQLRLPNSSQVHQVDSVQTFLLLPGLELLIKSWIQVRGPVS